MPLSDKEFALKILDFVERCILESAAYQVLLNKHVPNWRQECDDLLAQSAEVHKTVHENLEPMRNQVFEAPDLSSVVEQLLQDSQRNDPK